MPMLVNILLADGKRCVRERAEHPCAEAVCLGGALAARLATLPDTPHRSLLMSMSLAAPRRIFYGWFVVAAVFVTTTTLSGLAFYNLSILLAAFVTERGFRAVAAAPRHLLRGQRIGG